MIIKKGPYLQKPVKDAIVIMWETDVVSSSKVKVYDAVLPYVPVEKNIPDKKTRIYEGEAGVIHTVKIDNLAPGARYTYEVISETDGDTIVSDRYHFSCAPSETSAVSFVVTAEHGGCGDPENPYAPSMIKLIAEEHPDFILSVGDFVHNGLIEEEWATYLFTPFKEVLTSTPFYPCIGNHEVNAENIAPDDEIYRYPYWDKYFAFPHYYSFDYGCAHFCVLDAPAMAKQAENPGPDLHVFELQDDFVNTEQYQFLERDLAAAQGKWLFVVFHYPPYTSAMYEVSELRVLAPLFEKYGVDIVFNSHVVIYERSHPIKEGRIDPNGVRYIETGGYGEYDEWFRNKCSDFSAKISSRACYLRVGLTPDRMELQAVDYQGRLFDFLALEKEKKL